MWIKLNWNEIYEAVAAKHGYSVSAAHHAMDILMKAEAWLVGCVVCKNYTYLFSLSLSLKIK